MRVERSFASSDRGTVVEGEAANINAAGRSSAIMAETGAKLMDASTKLIQAKRKKDAAAIVADQLTSIQEETTQEYLKAQQSTVSSLDGAGPDAAVDSLEVLVDMPDAKNPALNRKPFSEYVLSSFDERSKERLAKISNPLARQELQKRLSYYRAQLGSEALSFEARSSLQLRKDLIGNAAERMGRGILLNPGSFDDQIIQLNTFVDNAKIGMDSPEVKRKMANELALSAAEGWISLDPVQAKKDLSEGKSSYIQHLTPQQVVSLQYKAEGRHGQLMAQERQDIAQLEDSHRESLLETGRGIPGFEARVKKAFADKPDMATQKLEKYKVWGSAYQHKSAIDELPVSEINTYIEKQKPVSGDEEYALKNDVVRYLSSLAEGQLSDAQKDPAHLAERLFPDELEKIPAENSRERALFRLAVQEKKGIPETQRRILTNSERDGIVTAIESAMPDQVLSVIQDISSRYEAKDAGQTLSNQLFKEITSNKGLDPTYNVLVQNVRDGAPVALDIVRTLKLKDELKNVLTEQADKEDLYSSVDNNMRDFSEAFLHGQAENIEALGPLREVAVNLAKVYVKERNMGIGDAAKRAVNLLVKDKIAKIDGELIIPTHVYDGHEKIQLNPGRVSSSLKEIKKDLLEGRMKYGEALTFGGAPKWVTEEHKKDIIQQAIKHGFWKANADFSGATLMVPFADGALPLLDENGNDFTVPFVKLENKGRKS